jgi:hypothetical protein
MTTPPTDRLGDKFKEYDVSHPLPGPFRRETTPFDTLEEYPPSSFNSHPPSVGSSFLEEEDNINPIHELFPNFASTIKSLLKSVITGWIRSLMSHMSSPDVLTRSRYRKETESEINSKSSSVSSIFNRRSWIRSWDSKMRSLQNKSSCHCILTVPVHPFMNMANVDVLLFVMIADKRLLQEILVVVHVVGDRLLFTLGYIFPDE